MHRKKSLRKKKALIELFPYHGLTVSRLVLNEQDILVPIDKARVENNTTFINALLLPFPNRICDGKYQFEGVSYQLDRNESSRGHALHGLLYDQPFEQIDEAESSDEIKASFRHEIKRDSYVGYPFHIEIVISIFLRNNQLRIDVKTKNIDDRSAPYGVGWHPYFYVEDTIDNKKLTIPSNSILKTRKDKELIPTGKYEDYISVSETVEQQQFDTCFARLHTHKTVFNTVTIFQDTSMNFLQLYTPPDRKSIAIEPMSCAPDAFNNTLGLVILNAGQSISHSFGIRAN